MRCIKLQTLNPVLKLVWKFGVEKGLVEGSGPAEAIF
jgi:hypothetical protein